MHIYQQLILKNKINKQAEEKQKHRYREHFDSCQMRQRVRGMKEKSEGIKKYKQVVTEQSQGYKIQHREQSCQSTYMHYPWTWSMAWGLPKGVAWQLGRWREGGESWDKCNSISNKIYFIKNNNQAYIKLIRV